MHRCPVRGCDVKDVDDEMLMCPRHWYMVPKPLQNSVYRAWQRGSGYGTKALAHAHRAAIESVNAKLAAR